MGFRESLRRANSEFRYWHYRRFVVGNPISLTSTVHRWWRRFWYEMQQSRKGEGEK